VRSDGKAARDCDGRAIRQLSDGRLDDGAPRPRPRPMDANSSVLVAVVAARATTATVCSGGVQVAADRRGHVVQPAELDGG